MRCKSVVRVRGLEDLRVTGLRDVADALAAHLARRHVAWITVETYLRVAAHFGRWLDRRGVPASRGSIGLFLSGHLPRCRCPGPVLRSRILVRAALKHVVAVPRVFRNRRGEPLTRFGVRYILRRCAARASAAAPTLSRRRIHPHVIRHSTAVHLLRSGVDLVTISHWLGHAGVETTNRYAVANLDMKRRALGMARPLTDIGAPDLAAWRTDTSLLVWLESL